ncbi:MAG: GNAT family N-acetyltransferase [Caldilineaceae bacterium]|nr:GNAT family N-acetyltransferase [Caldilineaceae bacterium]
MRAEFRDLGYRLNATEPVMVHALNEIPTFEQPALLERVTTHQMAERVNKIARSRQVLPEHIPRDGSLHTPIRQYVALIDDEIVGRVASIAAGKDTWVSNMYVAPEFRRRGIARSLLSQMLLDDRLASVRQSVLLATHTGAKLYPIVGYKEIGVLYIYTPPKAIPGK